jgi:hypothetical protein
MHAFLQRRIEMTNADPYQKPAHEALLALVDGATKLPADRIISLLQIIPYILIESGYSEICDSLRRLNEDTNCVFARLIEKAVNSIIIMKLNAEYLSGNHIDLNKEPIEKPRGITLPDKQEKITVAMIDENGLSELRMLATNMHILLTNPEPTSNSWNTMVELAINKTEAFFQRVRSKKSPM